MSVTTLPASPLVYGVCLYSGTCPNKRGLTHTLPHLTSSCTDTALPCQVWVMQHQTKSGKALKDDLRHRKHTVITWKYSSCMSLFKITTSSSSVATAVCFGFWKLPKFEFHSGFLLWITLSGYFSVFHILCSQTWRWQVFFLGFLFHEKEGSRVAQQMCRSFHRSLFRTHHFGQERLLRMHSS